VANIDTRMLRLTLGSAIAVSVDLASLPEAKMYEDRYQQYIDIFKRLATTPGHMMPLVSNAPWSWVPLLYYIGCAIESPRRVFEHCYAVEGAWTSAPSFNDRTLIEVLCGFRPETVDALWKVDMQWPIGEGRIRPDFVHEREFIVTNNGSFHRPEVREFLTELALYRPRKKNVVLVPCAADKPYPAPMHRAVLNMMPSNFYMANVTGVVGIAPQDLWDVMPHYDSGVPNRWRAMQLVKEYFDKHTHDRVIVYCDFYNQAIYEAFRSLGYEVVDLDDEGVVRLSSRNMHADTLVEFVMPVEFYADYVDLMAPDRLERLRKVIGS